MWWKIENLCCTAGDEQFSLEHDGIVQMKNESQKLLIRGGSAIIINNVSLADQYYELRFDRTDQLSIYLPRENKQIPIYHINGTAFTRITHCNLPEVVPAQCYASYYLFNSINQDGNNCLSIFMVTQSCPNKSSVLQTVPINLPFAFIHIGNAIILKHKLSHFKRKYCFTEFEDKQVNYINFEAGKEISIYDALRLGSTSNIIKIKNAKKLLALVSNKVLYASPLISITLRKGQLLVKTKIARRMKIIISRSFLPNNGASQMEAGVPDDRENLCAEISALKMQIEANRLIYETELRAIKNKQSDTSLVDKINELNVENVKQELDTLSDLLQNTRAEAKIRENDLLAELNKAHERLAALEEEKEHVCSASKNEISQCTKQALSLADELSECHKKLKLRECTLKTHEETINTLNARIEESNNIIATHEQDISFLRDRTNKKLEKYKDIIKTCREEENKMPDVASAMTFNDNSRIVDKMDELSGEIRAFADKQSLFYDELTKITHTIFTIGENLSLSKIDRTIDSLIQLNRQLTTSWAKHGRVNI